MAHITLPKWRDGRYKALRSYPGPRALEFMMLPQATPLAKPNLSHAQERDRAGPKRPMALTQLMKFSPTQSISNIRNGNIIVLCKYIGDGARRAPEPLDSYSPGAKQSECNNISLNNSMVQSI